MGIYPAEDGVQDKIGGWLDITIVITRDCGEAIVKKLDTDTEGTIYKYTAATQVKQLKGIVGPGQLEVTGGYLRPRRPLPGAILPDVQAHCAG